MLEAITRHRLESKRRSLKVRQISELSTAMRRITFTSPELADFISLGADDHIKLFFDVAGAREPVARDFTPRAFDCSACSLTIDFALHQTGPASDWARQAKVGDDLRIAGPRGSAVISDDFDWYLLVGDETALPAIGRRLAELPASAAAIVIALVEDTGHAFEMPTRADVSVCWLPRNGCHDDAALLVEQLQTLQLPQGDGFVWIAAEAEVAKALRQCALETLGHPLRWLKAAGYWRRNQMGAHEPL